MPDRLHDDDVAPFAALRRPAVEALARILYFRRATVGPPATDAACASWLRRQKRAVSSLRDAPALRRPRALSLLGDVFCFRRDGGPRLQEMVKAEAEAALCHSHRGLSPRVLAALAALVEDEARRRLDKAVQWKQKETEKKKKAVEEVAAEMWMESAAKVAALWTGRRRWEEKMRRPLDVALPACVRQGGCAACRLAVVGGSPQFLMDLRTGLVARHEHAAATCRERRMGTAEPPVLLRMVEAWIDACYTRRRRRHIRRESDMMAALVLRQRLGRREGGSRNRLPGGCWPETTLLMEVDVEALLGSDEEEAGEDDGEEGDEESVIEYAQGRWRRCRRTSRKEGYSQYLPVEVFAAVMVPERSPRRRMKEQQQQQQTNPPSSQPTPSTPPLPPRSDSRRIRSTGRAPAAPSSSLRASGSTVVEHQPPVPPWMPAPDPPTKPSLPTPPPSPAEAELAAIYDSYYRAGSSTASVRSLRPPSSLFTRSVPLRPVSPLSEYEPTNDERDDASLHPRPLRTRPRSAIPVPKNPVAGMPRESVHSVSSTVLLGCGRRWTRQES